MDMLHMKGRTHENGANVLLFFTPDTDPFPKKVSFRTDSIEAFDHS